MSSPLRPKLALPIKDKRIEDMLLWRDPKKSGIALGGITVVYLLISHISYNPVVVLANIAQFAVISCFLYNLVTNFLKRPGVPVPRIVANGVSESEAKDMAARYTVYMNKALALVEKVITGKDVVLTLQIAGALFVVSRVARVVSPLTLAYLGVLCLFSLPKLYELKKDEIDGHVSKAKDSYHNVYAKHVDPLMKKIPRASTASQYQGAGQTVGDKVSDTAASMSQ